MAGGYQIGILVRDKNGVPKVDDPVTLPEVVWAQMHPHEKEAVWANHFEKKARAKAEADKAAEVEEIQLIKGDEK